MRARRIHGMRLSEPTTTFPPQIISGDFVNKKGFRLLAEKFKLIRSLIN
jgi:hypothetical protein